MPAYCKGLEVFENESLGSGQKYAWNGQISTFLRNPASCVRLSVYAVVAYYLRTNFIEAISWKQAKIIAVRNTHDGGELSDPVEGKHEALQRQALPNHGHRVEVTDVKRDFDGESGSARRNLVARAENPRAHAVLRIRRCGLTANVAHIVTWAGDD